MYLIALCDDEPSELDKTEEILLHYRQSHPEAVFRAERFETTEELLYQIEEKKYAPDLIILDIYMPHKPGIDAAKELRASGNTCRIVFLTTSKEHALEAFSVEATQYLVKPLTEDALFPLLDRFLAETGDASKKYILLRIDGKMRRIAVSQIVYCEAQGKTQCLYFADGTHSLLRTTMAEIFEILSPYREFTRAGIAYIVNLEHVESLSRQELQMDNGKTIYPPRGSYQALWERYFNYYCKDDSE